MRKYYIDNLRSLTVVLVVVYHVIYMFNSALTDGVVGPFAPGQPQDAVQYILYPWFMVLLFLLAGMSARYALQRQSEREFFRARTRRLLVPSTIGLVFHWVQGAVNMYLSGAAEQMRGVPAPALFLIMVVSGTGVLWFIQMLWLYSALLLPLRRLERGRLTAWCDARGCSALGYAALAAPLWLSAQVLNAPVIAVYRFGIYGFAFLLGYYVFSREMAVDCLAKAAPVFLGLAAVLAAVYVWRYFGENYAVAPVVNSPLSMLYCWCACMGLLGGAKRWLDVASPAWNALHRHSWGLYIFHYLPLSICAIVLTERTALPAPAIYALTALAAFAGALALEAVISRIPVLRWCVLGIKKEAHHVQG